MCGFRSYRNPRIRPTAERWHIVEGLTWIFRCKMLCAILYNNIKNQFHGCWRLTFSWRARGYACMLYPHPPRLLNEKVIDGFYSRTRTIKTDCILKCAYSGRVVLKFRVYGLCIYIYIYIFK